VCDSRCLKVLHWLQIAVFPRSIVLNVCPLYGVPSVEECSFLCWIMGISSEPIVTNRRFNNNN
jgi:hypothetical protein